MSAALPGVALRADASPTSGTGHVVRCLSLAVALREAGARVCLVSRSLGVDVASLAGRAGVEWIDLPAPRPEAVPTGERPHAEWAGVGWELDARQTAERLAGWGCGRVVVDHYAFDARWHRSVSALLGARMAAIDDLADRPLDVDWLVDPNPVDDMRRKYAGLIGERTRVLGGPRYALLGPAYARLAPRPPDERVASIGLFLGGVDAAGLSALALRACREGAGFTGPIEIATTGANPHLSTLRDLAAALPPTTLQVDQPDLADFFARHGLQVGAGGGATWERCCAGVPMVLLVVAANQRVVVPPLVAAGAAAALPPGEPCDLANVGRLIADVLADADRRRRMAAAARALVDGLGARRVALALLQEGLALRPAREADAVLAHRWRNHPETRRVSRDSREIAFDDHVAWWQRALGEPNRRLQVAHVGSVDVGVLRLDIEDGCAEVSIYLDPALTGLGLGPRILEAAQRQALGERGPTALRAFIQPGNRASERAFAAAGFRRGEACWTWSDPTQAELSAENP